jgi:integrase
LTGLDIGDVDLIDGSVAVRKTKSRKARFTFVGRQACKAIAAYLRTRPDDGPKQPLWLVYQKDGDRNRISYDGLRSVIVRRSAQANVPCPSLHSFRRSFALTMLRNDADLVSLSRTG